MSELYHRALIEALISLKAIGCPEPLEPPDALICGLMARGALSRIVKILRVEQRSGLVAHLLEDL